MGAAGFSQIVEGTNQIAGGAGALAGQREMAEGKTPIARDTKSIKQVITTLEQTGGSFKAMVYGDPAKLAEAERLYSVADRDLAALRTALISDIRASTAQSYSMTTKSAATSFEESAKSFQDYCSAQMKTRSIIGVISISLTILESITGIYTNYQAEKREAIVRVVETELTLKAWPML